MPIKHARCPYCAKEFEYTSVLEHKSFPFCSSRCKDIDLGKWFMGSYVVPGPAGSAYDPDDPDSPEPEEMSPDRDAT